MEGKLSPSTHLSRYRIFAVMASFRKSDNILSVLFKFDNIFFVLSEHKIVILRSSCICFYDGQAVQIADNKPTQVVEPPKQLTECSIISFCCWFGSPWWTLNMIPIAYSWWRQNEMLKYWVNNEVIIFQNLTLRTYTSQLIYYNLKISERYQVQI